MNATIAAYIAGFLDGDGSIHLQLVRQREYRYGFYVRVSVSFHQHQSGRFGLEWLKERLGAGYLRDPLSLPFVEVPVPFSKDWVG